MPRKTYISSLTPLELKIREEQRPTIPKPAGHRMLRVGTVIRDGDLMFAPYDKVWSRHTITGDRVKCAWFCRPGKSNVSPNQLA